jgi:hypothetical protein
MAASTSTESKLKLSRRVSSPERKKGIFKFFTTVTRDEHLESIRKQDEQQKDLEEERQEQIAIRDGERLRHRRKMARERKRRQRDRQRKAVSIVHMHWPEIVLTFDMDISMEDSCLWI